MIEGFQFHPGALSRAEQEALAAEVFAAAEDAPFWRPVVPGGGRLNLTLRRAR